MICVLISSLDQAVGPRVREGVASHPVGIRTSPGGRMSPGEAS